MNDSAVLGIFASFMVFFIFIIFAIAVFSIVVTWKVYEKAGKPGWACLIPVYNTIVLLDIIGYKWYYIFFFCLGMVPIVGPIALLLFTLTLNVKLAKSFGKEIGFGIGLWIINIVFMAIIAFDKNTKYVGPAVKGDIDFNDLF